MLPAQLAGYGPSLDAARLLGRRFGGSRVNRARVAKAADRIAVALPALSPDERTELVLRSYEHLFELAVEFALAPRLLNEDGWPAHVELGPVGPAVRAMLADGPVILITGHCGNWEVLGHTLSLLGFPMHVLYRPLDVRPLDDWVRQGRARRGMDLLDKFGATERLPELLRQGALVGFVADQNAGDRGLFVPFFNRLASTYKTIGLLAIQHNAPVVVGAARRLPPDSGHPGLRYRLVVQDVIHPADWQAHPDPLFYLTARYRRGIQQLVEACPEQYLWMHRIWKSRPRHERQHAPAPPALRAKLAALPWLSADDVDALLDRSDRDAAWLAQHGVERLP
jgi:KDO2-lipid IV(A) lauroyltransferase